jgi:hypothetical protein
MAFSTNLPNIYALIGIASMFSEPRLILYLGVDIGLVVKCAGVAFTSILVLSSKSDSKCTYKECTEGLAMGLHAQI